MEKCAHAPGHMAGQTLKKGQGMQQPNTQRKGQGQAPAIETSANTANNLGAKKKIQKENMETTTEMAKEDEPSMREILQTVNNCKSLLLEIFDFTVLKQDVQGIGEWTSALEGRLSQVEDDVNPLKHKIKVMRKQLNMCIHKMDNIENRLHRKNTSVLGLPKNSEGNNPTEFMEDWLREMFGKDCLLKFFAIERAHRVPLRIPGPASPHQTAPF